MGLKFEETKGWRPGFFNKGFTIALQLIHLYQTLPVVFIETLDVYKTVSQFVVIPVLISETLPLTYARDAATMKKSETNTESKWN